MKPFLFPTILLLICAILTGCPNPEPSLPTFALGQPFELAPGESKQSADKGIVIKFIQVSGDSRCPAGVQCIWAGKADGDFHLSKNNAATDVTLSTGDLGQGGSKQTTFEGYTITLDNVTPPKQATGEIAQKDYRAILTVVK